MLLDMQFPASDRGQSYVVGELVESFANTVRSEAVGAAAPASSTPAPSNETPSAEPAATAPAADEPAVDEPSVETQVADAGAERDLAEEAGARAERDLADEAEALMRDLLCRAGDSASCSDSDAGQVADATAEADATQDLAEAPLGTTPTTDATSGIDSAAGENGTVAGTWTFEEIATAEAETEAATPPVEVPAAPDAVEETVATPTETETAAAPANTGAEIAATIPGLDGGATVAGQLDLAGQSATATASTGAAPESGQPSLAQVAQAPAEAAPPIEAPAEPAAPLPALSEPAAQEVATSSVAPVPQSEVTAPTQPEQLEAALAPQAGDAAPAPAPQAASTTQAPAPQAATATQTAALTPEAGDQAATASLVPPFSTPNDPIQSENESLVFLIQDRLNRLGYSGPRSIRLDGKLGPDTTSAIADYQRSHSLSVDGRASLHLLNHLDSQLTRRRGQPAQPVQAALAEPKPATDPRGGYESFRRGLAAARGGQAEDAIRYYTEAVDTVGWLERHLALAKRGDVYAKLGNYDMAIADYSAAIRLKPDYADAFISRAFAFQAKDQEDKAIADYRQARLLAPNNKWIAEQLEKMGATP